MLNNPFEIANRRFTGLESAAIRIIKIKFSPIRIVMDSVTSVFKTLDFSDEYQSKLGLSLWKLRCSLLFGLAPYSHEDLGLLSKGEDIVSLAERLPGSRDSALLMMDRLVELVGQEENPKLEWIVNQNWAAVDPVAIFTSMATRRSFGADLIQRQPENQTSQFDVITTPGQIGVDAYNTLVIPGTCQYLSPSLFMRIFRLGLYSRVHVLLYEGEFFRPKHRLVIPESVLLPGNSKGIGLQITEDEVIDNSAEADKTDDVLFSEYLFSSPCDTSLNESHGVQSRYILCDDGTGFHVAEKERIRVCREGEVDKLTNVFPAQLMEGDFVILESGNRKDLLVRHSNNQEFRERLDATMTWREPLQRLLLTRSLGEVASMIDETGYIQEMSSEQKMYKKTVDFNFKAAAKDLIEDERRNRNLRSTLSNWAEDRVYGPKDLQHMMALTNVLNDQGLLNIECSSEDAARTWFGELEKLRGDQRAAGRIVTTEISSQLEGILNSLTSLSDGYKVELENGLIASFHQLAMISDKVSIVSESLLKRPI